MINGVVPIELERNAPTFPKALTFLHVVPLGAQPYSVDLTNPHIRQHIDGLFPIAAKAFPYNKLTSRLNFDGQVNFSLSGSSPGRAMSYVQVLRDGAVEFCNANIIRPYGNSLTCYGTELDQHLVDGLQRTLQLYEQLILPLPYAVFATLTGVKNIHVHAGPFDSSIAFDHSNTVDRDQLFPSGQLIEQRDDKPEQVLKPILDAIWNASGHAGSFSYDEAGNWSRDPS